MGREVFGYENLLRAVNEMQATLLVCDRNRNVVFHNDRVCSALNIPEKELFGANLDALAERGYILNSASLQAFNSKKLAIRYVRGRMEIPILTVSKPVLDENGEVECVVAISINEQLVEAITKEMVDSRAQSLQLLDFLSSKIMDNVSVIAESDSMRAILLLLSRFSQFDSTILLTGETGVGKEVLAKYIHSRSERKSSIFIPVNCAAIPENLMESEFFGYAPGAFTGASKNGKAGFFELADGGTLFLDELGEMPLTIQAKFLRVIETGEVVRVGDEKSKKVNFRLIAATNRDLEKRCEEGLFRYDLYYRLNILSVEIPPLRKRRDDIIPLAKYFINNLNKKYGFSKILSYKAINQLKQYDWPGNVRELRNVIERLVISTNSDILDFDLKNEFLAVPEHVGRHMDESTLQGGPDGALEGIPPLKEMVDAYEKKVILSVLDKCGGSMAKTADVLKIHKSALYRKLDRLQGKPG